MDTNRKQWNQGQQKLQRALKENDHRKAIELFLIQHAMVHSAKVSKAKLWSFEDEVLMDLTEDQFRCIPPGGEHSIAWIIFHLARCEDITMNLLVAGTPQIFLKDGWQKRMNATIVHSGNSMDDRAMAAFSARVDIAALRAYRLSMGRRTRTIVSKLKSEQFKQKVDPARAQRIVDEEALLPEAAAILNYWSIRTIAGLLLMPPTRHNILHLNEALRIKQKLQR
ncbi:MAG TPA: DinB family protein [Anaerolineales bacterium]|nr:DinB family protein [Anaerolineales bacterium]